VILGLGEHDALAGDELRGLGFTAAESVLHRVNERGAKRAKNRAAWRLLVGIDVNRFAYFAQDSLVVVRLLQILFPFLAQILVNRALISAVS
jgi:hypothetical protein